MELSYFIYGFLGFIILILIIILLTKKLKKPKVVECPKTECPTCPTCVTCPVVEPVKPIEPVKPVEPVKPIEPSIPEQPAAPKPIDHVTPKPAEPITPVKPVDKLEEEMFIDALLDEVNYARTNPQDYAEIVRNYSGRFSSDEKDEAVNFLLSQRPLPALKYDRSICDIAGEPWLQTLVRTNQFNHGSWRERWGNFRCYFQESLAAGTKLQARDNVIMWIVDPGFPDKGHRRHVFNPKAISGCGIMKSDKNYQFKTLIGFYSKNATCNF